MSAARTPGQDPVVGDWVTVTSSHGSSRSGLLVEVGPRFTVELESGTRLRVRPEDVRVADDSTSAVAAANSAPTAPTRSGRLRRWSRAHPFRVAAAAVVAVLVVLGAIGLAAQATRDAGPTIAMPALIGLQLDDAHNALKDRGLRNFDDHDAFGDRAILVDANWTVVRQEPPADRLVAADATISLHAGKTSEDNTSAALGRPVRTGAPTTTAPTTTAPPPSAPPTTASPTVAAKPALETAEACDLAPLDYLASVGFEVEPCDETDVRRTDSADAAAVLDKAGNTFIIGCDAGPYDVTLYVTGWKVATDAAAAVDDAAGDASRPETGSITAMSTDLSSHGVYVDVPDNGAASAKWVVGAVQYDLLLQYYDLGWDHSTVLSTLAEGVRRVNAATSRFE